MEALTEQLLNDFQRDFPLQPQPFAAIAQLLNTDAGTVLQRLKELQDKGAVSRVGAVFKPNTVGASTLAAMSVPEALLETIAPVVSGFPQVNHNYEREHAYNLWFVATAASQAELAETLSPDRSAHGLFSALPATGQGLPYRPGFPHAAG